MWWRYLAVETTGSRRDEIELLLTAALEKDGISVQALAAMAEPATVSGDESHADLPPPDEGWEPEVTKTDVRRASAAGPAEPDPLDQSTAVVDVTALQEQERQVRAASVHDVTSGDVTTGVVRRPGLPTQLATHAVPGGAIPGAMFGEQTNTGAIALALGASVKLERPSGKLRPPALDPAVFLDGKPRVDTEPVLDVKTIEFPQERVISPDDSDVVMLSYEQLQPATSGEGSEEILVELERELSVAASSTSTSLRLEAGRLAESIGELDRARAHYEAAVLANPRTSAALRGLRRIARSSGDLLEVTRLVEAEIAVSGEREAGPLSRYRIDLLMASGEQDVARVAVGELLDNAPMDIHALLAHLELAFLDDRAEEFGQALELLARAVSEPGLRGAVLAARAVLAAHHGDSSAAAVWLTAAAEADPDSPATRLGAIRHAAAQGMGNSAGMALFDLACHVESEDPITAAALAVRAQMWTSTSISADAAARETMAAAAQLAARAAPRDILVARITSESALVAGDPTITSNAFARWGRSKGAPVERAYAAARAAELDPGRLGRLWAQVLELDPGDDYATAHLRSLHVAAGETRLAVELDVQVGDERESVLLRAASEMLDHDQVDEAIGILMRGATRRPTSAIIGVVLAEALARAGRWVDRAKLFGELAAGPGPFARDVNRLRSARAWEQAVRVAATEAADVRERVIIAALDAWDLVLKDAPNSAIAHAASIGLARQLDPGVLMDVLARAQAAEQSSWAASSLALRRALLMSRRDPRLAQDVAHDAAPKLDDPRSSLVVMMAAAQRHELGEAASALEERAARLETERGPDASAEPATLRFRAAQLALDGDDLPRAESLLARIAKALPTIVDDLVDTVRRRAGAPPVARAGGAGESFTRILRDADLAASRGEHAPALELYQRALEIRHGDPFAAAPLVRIATRVRDATPIAGLALEQLRSAEAFGDVSAKAEAYELLARVDSQLRDDPTSAQISLESAAQADPTRIDLMQRLEHELATKGRYADLFQLREREIDQITQSPDAAPDVVAMLMDAATLAVRSKRPDAKTAELYRAVLAIEPAHRRALFHLESISRKVGFSDEVAQLEERIAASFSDPRAKAAFLTRAGDTLVGLGKPVEAVQRFTLATEAVPGYLPALEAWHQTALANELWLELAEAATRRARQQADAAAPTVAALHHFAGVVLMDRTRAFELAITSLLRALEAEPGHVDAFQRLRILFESTDRPEELASLLQRRLAAEPDRTEQVELHSSLAEHHRAIGEREAAMRHYRAMLTIDPTLARAHAAIAALASEQGTWQAAAAAVNARVPLERDPRTLKTLHYRLGVLYAPHDVPTAIAAFQRALTYQPGDVDSLVRLTDLAIRAADWKIALDACNELVTIEREPQTLALHLYRAATIFSRGFADRERSERMLDLAFDSAPTSSEGLRLLLQFYADVSQPAALRKQLDKIVVVMRARVAQDAKDGAAYRILSRAIAARAEGPRDRSLSIARAAAELAVLLGAGAEAEQQLIVEPPADLSLLRADDLLFSHALQPELRQIFRLVGTPIIKHVGVDLAAWGVGRKDRLHPTDPTTAIVKEIASSLGFKDVELYVSTRLPFVMVAEPTNPVAVVLGAKIIASGARGIRFASGAALKLAQLSLAIPARLMPDELGVLGLALVRLARPGFTSPNVNLDEVNAQMPKLRKLISENMLDEVRPHALALTTFSHQGFSRDLKIAGLRAGLAASGTLLPLTTLAASVNTDVLNLFTDPVIAGLISFALGEDRLT